VSRLAAGLRVLCIWCCSAAIALAQALGSVPVREISVTWNGVPQVSFSLRDFVDDGVVAKLQSGLPQTLTTRLLVYRDFTSDPLAAALVSCRVVYDLWEGGYRIERETETGARTLNVKTVDAVITHCLTFLNHRIGDTEAFQRVRGSEIYLGVVTELNPLSRDAVQRIRRWLARPAGSELSGNAFFGTFVSIFVGRKLGSAERTLSFRSTPSGVPP